MNKLNLNLKILIFYLWPAYPLLLAQTPISLHPENSHYFLFRGKPTVLISSAEHYGMALNAELDYITYLDVLEHYGFNQTRIFTGVYCEGNEYPTNPGNENKWEEMQNTLAPRPYQLITPWARSQEPGYINGGNKFDLNKWDEAYFTRLKDFLREADQRNVVVEIVLFTANYTPKNWQNSPLNAINNINQVGEIPYNEFHLIKHREVIEHQLKMTGKIVTEVNEFDNIYFEICNEPYWMKGIPRVEESITEQQFLPEIDEWQNLIVQRILETEQSLPKKHLIAQNFANSYLKIQHMDSAVSVLNFHYAFPPVCVPDNYQWNRPLGFDETADGCNAPDRRREAWAFMLAGGAVYSNLDWSFAIDDLTGLGRNPPGKRQSGKEVREQLRILLETIKSFDFINARPINDKHFGDVPQEIGVYGLFIEGQDYIFYWLKRQKTAIEKTRFSIPSGEYLMKFINPLDGQTIAQRSLQHAGGDLSINLPAFPDDLVVRITRVEPGQ